MTTSVRRATTLAGVALLSVALAAAVPASAQPHPRAGTGPWHLVDGTGKARAGAPVLWENSSHVATVLWYRQDGPSDFTYQTITVSAKGKPAASSTDAFNGQHWEALSFSPTLLSSGGKPLVVFDGSKGSNGPYSLGCVYGARGDASPWTLQNWSLSADCVNPIGPAAENGSGTLLAAWPGGQGVLYRIGTSTIPASGSDSQIVVKTNGAVASKVGAAADSAGAGHFYVSWTRVFSTNHTDGIYVKDVTANGATTKVPNTGTNSTNHAGQASNLAMANRNTHSGVYLASCANAPTCSLQLWRVGARKAMAVPSSSNAFGEAVSAGPSGRLWLAWFNTSTNKVSVVRTNRAVTKFGRVQTYATACAENGLLGLSGGSSGRVDVALDCVANKSGFPTYVYATQVLVPLSVSLSPQTVHNTAAHNVTVTVRDAGDPVAHATVRYGTQHPMTNSSGRTTIHVAKGTSTGAKHVSVSATDYKSGGATLHVTH
jgi:hypothetical protein